MRTIAVTQIERQGRWLRVRLSEAHCMWSWAVVGGGQTRTDTVAWYRVTKAELKPPLDPRQFLTARLAEASIPKAVGLLTSADLDLYGESEITREGITVHTLATVGITNALRVGDPPRSAEPVGTVNLLCRISRALSKEAFLEALALAAEARTAAFLESEIPSTETGQPATGTGTDCIVIAAPVRGEALHYVGKHTNAGHLIGTSVLEAVRSGLRKIRINTRCNLPGASIQ